MIVAWAMPAGQVFSQETPLIVRDVQVGFVAKSMMNDRTAFRSTLPAVVLSQRPAPAKPSDTQPQPLGVITFEGPPVENLDVLLEYDNAARLLGRWPHTDARSTRSLWRKLNLVSAKNAPSTAFPATSWLNPLRNADRLSLEFYKRTEKFILYDITLRSPTTIELESADTGYKARNIGAAAIHDVTVYRPTSHGKFRAAYTKELPGLGKTAPPAETPAAPVAQAATAQRGLLAAVATALTGQASPAPAAAVAGQPPVAPPNTPQHDIAWAGEEQTVEELLAGWESRLTAQGLGKPEVTHVLSILRTHAFDKDSARVVFRLDPSAIETLAPLEVTPQPDKLVRVWLVILDGADPEIKTRIAKLITELGDPSYEKRMQAKAQLLKLGPIAVPQLNAEKGNKDVEVSFRAEEILEEVQNPSDQGNAAAQGVILEE